MASILKSDVPQSATDQDPGIGKSVLWIIGLVVFQLMGILIAWITQAAISGEPMMRMTQVDGQTVPVPNLDAVTMMFGVFLGAGALIALRAKYLCRHLRPAWDGSSPHALSRRSILMTGALIIGVMLFTLVYQTAIGEQPIQPELILFLNAMNSGYAGLAVVFLAGAIGAPVLEEILFRGQLQGAIQKKLEDRRSQRAPIYAIAITSAVFSLIHFQPLAIPPLFVAGAAFGWIRWRSGSLALPIAAHVLMNFISLVLLYFTGEI